MFILLFSKISSKIEFDIKKYKPINCIFEVITVITITADWNEHFFKIFFLNYKFSKRIRFRGFFLSSKNIFEFFITFIFFMPKI